MTYEEKCVMFVNQIATYSTWREACRLDWEEDNDGMTFEEYYEAAQTDIDWLTAQDETLENIIYNCRQIVGSKNE